MTDGEVALRTAVGEAVAAPVLDVDLRGATLRAEVLRDVLLTAVPVPRLVLRHAVIGGMLDLSGTALAMTPCLVACTLPDGIDLTDARVRGVEVLGGRVGLIRADRMTASGTVLLRSRVHDAGYEEHDDPATPVLVIERMILLSGARIRGNLDLRGTRVGGDPIRPGQPEGTRLALSGDGLSVRGNLLISHGFDGRGEIRLNGCRIGRNLDATAASLRNPRGFTLSAAGAEVRGTVYLCRGRAEKRDFLSEGTLRLEGARVRGDLDLRGGRFTATAFAVTGWQRAGNPAVALHAIAAEGVRVDAALKLRGAVVRGVTRLLTARIGGDVDATRATLSFPGEEVLQADGATVNGGVFLDGLHCDGLVRLQELTVAQGLVVVGARFSSAGACRHWLGESALSAEVPGGAGGHAGLHLAGAKITGGFVWKAVTREAAAGEPKRLLWLSALGASADVVEDDRESWFALDRVDLRDCEYAQIDRLGAGDRWRLEILDREHAPANRPAGTKWWRQAQFALWLLWIGRLGRPAERRWLAERMARFTPQPYLALARVFSRASYQGEAEEVLVRLERNRARYSGSGVTGMLWRWVLDGALRHGFSRSRPVWLLLVWAAVSAVCFQAGWQGGRIVPSPSNAPKVEGARPHVTFNAIVFALDTLVPIVDFNQKKEWMVEPLTRAGCGREEGKGVGTVLACTWRQWPDRWVAILVLFNTVFGWLMTTLFAAGLSGVLRSPRAG